MPSVGLQSLHTYAEEDVTIDATSGGVGLTVARYRTTPPADAATLTVETARIRWTKSSDRNLVAGSRGHPANVGAVIFLDNLQEIANFRAIRTSSTSGSVHAEYHRR